MAIETTVPDFFQEESLDALRSQVDWITREFSVEDSFFARLIGTDASIFSGWRAANADISPQEEETLRHFWRTVLHLLSLLNFDSHRMRSLFQETMPVSSTSEKSALDPPWSGSNLKTYLEQSHEAGIDKVECWVTGLRFGEPYAA